MNMDPVLVIDVDIDEVYEVAGERGRACMLLFHGSADCDSFKGRILPGAVDTQKQENGSPNLISARYILEGRDHTGEECRIFIENNSLPESEYTRPLIYTDSYALKWLEAAELCGAIKEKEGGVVILIYKK
ncbi:MAG: DUF3237 domain-containing protein [Lachnospiraceae bacterium]|nr:DUF3237 domain-containing protein [Lachnospiraceae bacterium]